MVIVRVNVEESKIIAAWSSLDCGNRDIVRCRHCRRIPDIIEDLAGRAVIVEERALNTIGRLTAERYRGLQCSIEII